MKPLRKCWPEGDRSNLSQVYDDRDKGSLLDEQIFQYFPTSSPPVMFNCIYRPFTDEVISLEIGAVLNVLPPWRREKALSYKFDRDRYACAKVYLLLKELLREHYGITEDVEFGYGPYGKPFLKSFPGIHFSMSHCPGAVFCGVGDAPVGVDVEEIQYDEDVAGEVFSVEELNMIHMADVREIRFTELWTKKEAYLKLTGTGIADDLKTILSAEVRSGVSFETEVDVSGGTVRTVAHYLSSCL